MPNLVTSIVVGACLGALVGLIRQWSDQKDSPERAVDFGGVRTYTFLAILGCTGAFLADQGAVAVLPVLLAAVALHLTALHFRDAVNGHPGSTTFAASLLTCLLGALVWWGQTQAAILIAATTAVMIGLKQPIHAWTRAFTVEDIRATLQFIAITGVVLPLVPDRNYGPFAAFNPTATWLMVVLISGVGFVGYIMMRLLGAKAGISITGLVGGLASSTATALAFSRRSKDEPELSSSYALAVVVACTVMLARILVVVGLLNRDLAVSLLLPFLLMAVPGAGFALWVWFRNRRERSDVAPPTLHNPLSLSVAIKFGLIYAVVAFLVKAATSLGLQSSLLPLSFVSGLTDMDAIALLMANSRNDASVAPALAAQCVIVAAVGNSVLKGGFAVALGSPALRRQVALVLGLTIVVGLAALQLVR
ncbi:MAG TPA: DUF4010 domain-containing protein [Opitutaceae bacterium]|nr:DUF4010 domain-containing protein [Opitutaceae bacterium]